MRVVVTGSSGLVGSALVAALAARGDEAVRLVRRRPGPGEARWDPAAGTLDTAALADAHAVVHLAGAGIGDRRWTPERRAEIRDSRVGPTALLARTVAELGGPALLSASAVGFYGYEAGDRELDETAPAGRGFLADVCQAWEGATEPAAAAGVRVVHLRSGVVLSAGGGALGRQLPLFRLGVGGRLGSGRQWLSWIGLDDEVGAIAHLLDHPELTGPVNLTAPGPVTNAEFTRTLGRALHRPAVLAVPAPALRLALGGGLADEALLGGQRVLPRALEASGYRFGAPDLDTALARCLAG